jgi:hypothetical protein
VDDAIPSNTGEVLAFLRERNRWIGRRKLLVYGLAVAVAINLVLLSTLVYYGFLEPSWLTYKNMPFPVPSPSFQPGDAITFVSERCNDSGHVQIYSVTRTLIRIDAPQPPIELAAGDVEVPAGCTTFTSKRNTVPLGNPPVPPGQYKLAGTTFVPLRWRTERVTWETQPFSIKEADGHHRKD